MKLTSDLLWLFAQLVGEYLIDCHYYTYYIES